MVLIVIMGRTGSQLLPFPVLVFCVPFAVDFCVVHHHISQLHFFRGTNTKVCQKGQIKSLLVVSDDYFCLSQEQVDILCLFGKNRTIGHIVRRDPIHSLGLRPSRVVLRLKTIVEQRFPRSINDRQRQHLVRWCIKPCCLDVQNHYFFGFFFKIPHQFCTSNSLHCFPLFYRGTTSGHTWFLALLCVF